MKKTLVSSSYLFVFVVLGLNGIFGQNIQRIETLKFAPDANFRITPCSFCVTEDKFFLIPDTHGLNIKVFEKVGNFLKSVSEFGRGTESFIQPRFCFYSQDGSKFGVLDYGVRKGFIFEILGKVEFKHLKTFDCKKFGYDVKFAGDVDQTIVSGYVTDNEDKPFDLYGINSETGKIVDYLLPSQEKYGLSTYEAYVEEYYKKQTLPAIGIKAFFDIQGDDLFFVWEGALRIIKFNLQSKEITQVFGHEISHYNKPDGSMLNESYIKGDFGTTWKLLEKFSYVRNIFATSNNVFIVYETGKKNEKDISTFRLQIYTIEGDFIKDLLIPGTPGRQMWLDKESNELYAFTDGSVTGKGEFAILKYKITR